MNKEQKAEKVAQIATAIRESDAVFAVDYRGISVPQAAELRTRLIDAGARFSVVKNTLTERAADDAGVESLKGFLEGPTAFTFVSADGDVALAAKALSQFRRANSVLEFKGGIMNGEPLSVDQIESIARLPAVDVLRGQLVGVLASPVTGLVRGLNQLIAGVAIALAQIRDEGKVGGGASAEAPAETEAAAEDAPAEAAAEEPPGESAEQDEPAEAAEQDEPTESAEQDEPAESAEQDEPAESAAEDAPAEPAEEEATADAAPEGASEEARPDTETETEDTPSENQEEG